MGSQKKVRQYSGELPTPMFPELIQLMVPAGLWRICLENSQKNGLTAETPAISRYFSKFLFDSTSKISIAPKFMDGQIVADVQRKRENIG